MTISLPAIETNGILYYLTWTPEMVEMRFDHFHQRSDDIYCELTIRSLAPGYEAAPLLSQGKLNLRSTQGRKALAKELEERMPQEWSSLLTQACVKVLERYRQGEPVIDLATHQPSEGLEYRLRPILRDKETTVLFGAGGSGKTSLALFAALLVQSNTEAAGFLPDPGPVLFLDYEASPDEVHHRLVALAGGLKIDMPHLHYRFCVQPLADEVEEIQRTIFQEHIQVVVVDSLGMACGDEPEKAGPVLAFFRGLRALRVTSLVVHHANREGKLYGNVYVINQARSLYEVKASQETGSSLLHIGLHHRKVNRGQLQKPLGLTLDFADETHTLITQTDLLTIPDLSVDLPLKEQIRAELLRRKQPTTVKELTESLGKTKKDEAVLRVILNRYKKLFAKDINDRWALRSFEDA